MSEKIKNILEIQEINFDEEIFRDHFPVCNPPYPQRIRVVMLF